METKIVDVIPDSTEVVVVSKYYSKSWWEVVSLLCRNKKTGCVELHMNQGKVGAVMLRETEK